MLDMTKFLNLDRRNIKMEKQKKKLEFAGEVGGYQLFHIGQFEELDNPKNLAITEANNQVKIITTYKEYAEMNPEEVIEVVIRGMSYSYASSKNESIGARPSVDETIKCMEEFREINGPLSPHIDSDRATLETLSYPCGHDRNTANLATYNGADFITVSNSAQGILLGSIPKDLIRKRGEELERAREARLCNNAIREVHLKLREGTLSIRDLENITEVANKSICPQFGERLMTSEIVKGYLENGLDYLPFEVARLKSQSAIFHYLESRREK